MVQQEGPGEAFQAQIPMHQAVGKRHQLRHCVSGPGMHCWRFHDALSLKTTARSVELTCHETSLWSLSLTVQHERRLFLFLSLVSAFGLVVVVLVVVAAAADALLRLQLAHRLCLFLDDEILCLCRLYASKDHEPPKMKLP